MYSVENIKKMNSVTLSRAAGRSVVACKDYLFRLWRGEAYNEAEYKPLILNYAHLKDECRKRRIEIPGTEYDLSR